MKWLTDVALLRDAVRKLVKRLAVLCRKHGFAGWRRAAGWLGRAKRACARVRTVRRRSRADKVSAYPALWLAVIKQAEGSLRMLHEQGIGDAACARDRDAGTVLMDPVSRCLLHGERIAHSEKLFSFHAPHIRRLDRKAGMTAELGVPVCVMEDLHQFVPACPVLPEGRNRDMLHGVLAEALRRCPTIKACSLDKGCYTPANLEKPALLALPVLPKHGRRSASGSIILIALPHANSIRPLSPPSTILITGAWRSCAPTERMASIGRSGWPWWPPTSTDWVGFRNGRKRVGAGGTTPAKRSDASPVVPQAQPRTPWRKERAAYIHSMECTAACCCSVPDARNLGPLSRDSPSGRSFFSRFIRPL